ncbi:MAG: hypothetical protein K2K92_02690 [Duncaniella sp.]|nr:hypothetical protein [Duncaniella sp.]
MDEKTIQEYRRMMREHRAACKKTCGEEPSVPDVAVKDGAGDECCVTRESSEGQNPQPRLLLKAVKEDIETFISTWPGLLRNEIDFQINLGTYLINSLNAYDRVFFEYRVPKKWLGAEYVWNGNLRIDIVVVKDDEYLPVELKYPTAQVRRKIKCFDEDLSKDGDKFEPVLKHQGAIDLVCYSFWKDVRRIEILKNKFRKVNGGLAVLLTNDMKYLTNSGEGPCCTEFLISENNPTKGPGRLAWRGAVKVAEDRAAIDLDNQYYIKWNDARFDGVDFKYLIIEVI